MNCTLDKISLFFHDHVVALVYLMLVPEHTRDYHNSCSCL